MIAVIHVTEKSTITYFGLGDWVLHFEDNPQEDFATRQEAYNRAVELINQKTQAQHQELAITTFTTEDRLEAFKDMSRVIVDYDTTENSLTFKFGIYLHKWINENGNREWLHQRLDEIINKQIREGNA